MHFHVIPRPLAPTTEEKIANSLFDVVRGYFYMNKASMK